MCSFPYDLGNFLMVIVKPLARQGQIQGHAREHDQACPSEDKGREISMMSTGGLVLYRNIFSK